MYSMEQSENALRELVNARAVWRAYVAARREAIKLKGSMSWKHQDGHEYLVSRGTAGEHLGSLGRRGPETERILTAFRDRKVRAQQRLESLKQRVNEQRQLNRVYRVGRAPAVVVRTLAALEEAQLADRFIVMETQALFAYEAAAGVRIHTPQDPELLEDVQKRMVLFSTDEGPEQQFLVRALHKADPTFSVEGDRALNGKGFRIDLRSSRPPEGRLLVDRHFEHLVVATNGEMAIMRTLHPLDFVRLKRARRDTPRDQLQADVVQHLWDVYLVHLAGPHAPPLAVD
jgi:hypothetical protein